MRLLMTCHISTQCSRVVGMNPKPHERSIALITGANRGLGLEVSRQLGQKGYVVLLGCRSDVRGAEAERLLQGEGIDAHAIHLDVASSSSITAARQRVEARFHRLDVLVNNAPIHYDTWQRVTHVGWDIVTQALDVN